MFTVFFSIFRKVIYSATPYDKKGRYVDLKLGGRWLSTVWQQVLI